MSNFSLWSEQWIPVIDSTGEAHRYSLRDTLVHAKELREVFDPSPLVEVAVFRLLQAIIYRVFVISDDDEWVDLWKAGSFDARLIDQYGEQLADHFDLLHPTRPFYQVAKIKDEKEHPISALVLEAASGNNATLFDHGQVEGRDWLSLDRAACHLLAYQAFALGGGVSKPFNRMDAPLAKGMVVQAVGRNLFESLLLNSMPLTRWEYHISDMGDDIPFWEMRYPPTPRKEGTEPLGPMHYLTWQSRQLHLCLDDSGTQVVGCQIRQRYALPKTGEQLEPHKPYRSSDKEGWQPLRLHKEKAVWQYSHVLLQADPNSKQRAPLLTDWMATVVGRRFGHYQLDLPPVIGYSVVGMATDPRKAAKIDLWRREKLPIPYSYFSKPELVDELGELMVMASKVDRHLSRTAEILSWVLAERAYLNEAMEYLWTSKTKSREAQRSLDNYKPLAKSICLNARFWAALGESFYQVLTDLPQWGLSATREQWRKVLIRIACGCFEEVRNSLLCEERAFAVLAPLDTAFHQRLFSILKDNEGEEENADEKDDSTVE